MNNPQITYGSPRTEAFCNPGSPWSASTQLNFAAVYRLPWDIQTSANVQAYPGMTIAVRRSPFCVRLFWSESVVGRPFQGRPIRRPRWLSDEASG
jgi:hypothetical protein